MLYQAIRILSGLKYHKLIFQLIGVLVAYCPRNSSSVNQGPGARFTNVRTNDFCPTNSLSLC